MMRKGIKVSNGVKNFIFTPLETIERHQRAMMSLTGSIIILLITIFLVTRIEAIDTSVNERIFFIEERMVLKNLPNDLNGLRIWIPHPVNDNWQAIEDYKLTAPFKVDIIMDKEYGNRILLLKLKKDATYDVPIQITLSFMAKRREYSTSGNLETSSKNLSRFLKADRLVPVNGGIKKLAEEMTRGKSNDLEKARAIYDYLIDELIYSKDDPKVCGIGDSLLTLQYKKGICTDYHSLFISLVRSLGIPAKFEIGFRIPKEPQEGKLNGYHCWAKFYIKGKGWIPVDISEADKNPEKRGYYFGSIDEDRIRLSTGRDIIFKEANDSASLNFFVYPYAELNGLQFNDMDIEISYKALKGGG